MPHDRLHPKTALGNLIVDRLHSRDRFSVVHSGIFVQQWKSLAHINDSDKYFPWSSNRRPVYVQSLFIRYFEVGSTECFAASRALASRAAHATSITPSLPVVKPEDPCLKCHNHTSSSLRCSRWCFRSSESSSIAEHSVL
jgi:hypothetical protein